MQSLQAHAPQMKEIQKKYKGDKAKQNEELMKFYKENQINPAASCLPMLAQFPVFIALYYSLRAFSREPAALHPGRSLLAPLHPGYLCTYDGLLGRLRAALLVYVASQMASTLYMSATADKTQRTIFMLMPLVFVFVIAHFPAGLVLYWVTTNLWTVGQGLITRRLMPKTPAPSLFERKSSRTPPRDAGDGDGNGAKKAPTRRSRRRRGRSSRRGKCAGRRPGVGDRRADGRDDGRDRGRGEVGGTAGARAAVSGARQVGGAFRGA